jgi:ABC-type Zn uptake system ZnuABC Zn-binding protein ZnuA
LRSLLIFLLVLVAAGCEQPEPAAQPTAPAEEEHDHAEEPIDLSAITPITEGETLSAEEHDHAEEPIDLSAITPITEGETLSAEEHDHAEEPIDLSAITPITEGETLSVVATTSIVGDVVSNVGGSAINLTVLMPSGTDPHTFEPTPQDLAVVSDADIVFANGVGLELFMESMLESTGVSDGKVIHVSHGIELIEFDASYDHDHAHEEEADHAHEEEADHAHEEEADHAHEEEADHAHEEEADHAHEEEADHAHDHSGLDPHVWFSPVSVEGWVDNIEYTLRHADPANSDIYRDNAVAYRGELHNLDTWIKEQVAHVPEADRKLVTDHTAFGYFAHHYGFEQIGAVVPAYSTMAEPSAQELAELEDAIREHEVPAIFVGTTVNPNLSERVAQDTGTDLVPLYTGSLSEAGGEADTYLKLMRYDVQAIVGALSNE